MRYQVDKVFGDELYSVFDTETEKYLVEFTNKQDAEVIAYTLNKYCQ